MARLIHDRNTRLPNGDRIIEKAWQKEDGGLAGLSFVYRAWTGTTHERVYGIDQAHGVVHEHHGANTIRLEFGREVLAEVRRHFLRVAGRIQSARRQDLPDPDPR